MFNEVLFKISTVKVWHAEMSVWVSVSIVGDCTLSLLFSCTTIMLIRSHSHEERCKTVALIIILTVAILLSKELGEMERAQILNDVWA
jgi:hypothetical protein